MLSHMLCKCNKVSCLSYDLHSLDHVIQLKKNKKQKIMKADASRARQVDGRHSGTIPACRSITSYENVDSNFGPTLIMNFGDVYDV